MILFSDYKLTGVLKEYDLTYSVDSTPVSFSNEFEVRMEKLIRKKQRNYNVRMILQHAVPALAAAALVGSLFFLLLQQRGIDNEPVTLQDTPQVIEQDTVHVPAVPAARGNIYDRNGVLLISSRMPSDGNSHSRNYHTEYAPHLLVDIETTGKTISGQHVYLTIDINLQAAAERALRTQIEIVNHSHQKYGYDEAELISGGAVVVTDVKTGDILAAASYPTFNLSRLAEEHTLLTSDPANPMLNRATQGLYSPGSTFQMVTAFTGLRNIPRLTKDFTIDDTGTFDRYSDAGGGFVVNCWRYSYYGIGHGPLDIVQALECSCDFFFTQVSDWLGPARDGAYLLAEAAQEFGLGIATGVEIPENEGRLALPDVREAITGDNVWYAADTLLAGIGLGDNRFTPVQMANYAATIANGGTLYSMSLIRSVRDPGNSEEIFTHESSVINVIEETDIIEILQEGMIAASRGRNGTARHVFGDSPITVASKTGSVQIEGRDLNDCVFVAYAPADNPEIAISLVVEKGGSSPAIFDISRIIIDHYFDRGIARDPT